MAYTDADDVYATATAAADLIERDGLFHGSFWGLGRATMRDYSPGMSVCILGAIRVVIGHYNCRVPESTPWGRCATTTAVHREISARAGGNRSVASWNDDLTRTTPEAVALLRDVAAKHRPDAYRGAAA